MPGRDRPALTRRQRVLGILALAPVAASIWALNDDDGAIDSRAAPRRGTAAAVVRLADAGDTARPPNADVLPPLTLPERGVRPAERRNLFAATAVAAASASAASAPAPPPARPALSLPYSFAGRLVTPDGASVLLNDGAMTRVLARGETLGDFRFEQDGGFQLEFIHVPSGEHLVLALQP